ncbi:MAG: NADH-quinone oxidoreductase subunit H [Elusimicrobia bacterium]|nr:NADH-quinone oxidoreductase subunit H [Elusimicrobiota bacterium]
MKITLFVLQIVVLIIIAPLVSGIIRKIKNNFRMRQGPGIFQPYFNIIKLFGKEEIVSEHTSWIFSFTPYIVLASLLTALMLVPGIFPGISLNHVGDFFALIFLLSLGRFFLALSGLDAGSSFGGMGSSREMFISALTEPAFFVAVFALCLGTGTTDLNVLSTEFSFNLSHLVAGAALFMVTIVETSRIPIDNQETHLELTMVHEAMILEYSGRSLALIELAAQIKQIIFFSLLSIVIFPVFQLTDFSMSSILVYSGIFISKILLISFVVAVIEVTVAKMRLFRVPDFTTFAFVLSGTALVLVVLGL